MRGELHVDEPCMVCGSKHHPGHDDKVANELLELMRTRTLELEEKISLKTRSNKPALNKLWDRPKRGLKTRYERRSFAKNKLEELQLRTTVAATRGRTGCSSTWP